MSKLAAYRQAHQRYLAENQPRVYADQQKRGQLEQHLQDVAVNAVEQEERLTQQMIDRVNSDQSLRDNYPRKVKALEAIPHVVDELVTTDVMHQPAPNPI